MVVLFCLLLCAWRYTLLFTTYLLFLALFNTTMIVGTRFWKYCWVYFFLFSFLLDRTTISSPPGSDDFIVLLQFHIVRQLVKFSRKNRNVVKVFKNLLQINHRLRRSNRKTLSLSNWNDCKYLQGMSCKHFFSQAIFFGDSIQNHLKCGRSNQLLIHLKIFGIKWSI